VNKDCIQFQPYNSRTTKDNIGNVKTEIEHKITKDKLKELKKKEKKVDIWSIEDWRHKINKNNKHSRHQNLRF